ncbi:MAG: hypothetical protein LKJ90_07735 [Faecalibacterium sp.]|jgi:hypothetical protein|nr:hypothetical protein [Faecalibacterium sp.]
MKKRILSLLFAAAVACTFCMGAFAEGQVDQQQDSTVTYTGQKALTTTGNDQTFSGVLPGSTCVQTITLSNDSGTTADFYMDLSTLPFESGTMTRSASSGIAHPTAYTIDLTVTQGDTTSTLYSDTAGGQNASGLQEFQNSLTGTTVAGDDTAGKWMNVAQLKNGQTAMVKLTMTINGSASANDYQNKLASIDYRFLAQDTQTHTVTVTKTNTQTNTLVRQIVQRVQTGDTAPLLLLGIVFAVGIILLVLLIHRGKKNKQQNKQ